MFATVDRDRTSDNGTTRIRFGGRQNPDAVTPTETRPRVDPSQIPRTSGAGNWPDVMILFELLGASIIASFFSVLEAEKKPLGWRHTTARLGTAVTAALMIAPIVIYYFGDNAYIVMSAGAISGTFTDLILTKMRCWIDKRFPIDNVPDPTCPPDDKTK